ncbi:hypothetical protein D3C84_651100 [compost metagenome]
MNQGFERGAVDLDHFVEAVDGRVGRHAREAAAQWNDLQACHGVGVQVELLANHFGGAFRQWVLTEQGGGDIGQAEAGAVGQVLPRQVFTRLGIEDRGGQGQARVVVSVGLLHGESPIGLSTAWV